MCRRGATPRRGAGQILRASHIIVIALTIACTFLFPITLRSKEAVYCDALGAKHAFAEAEMDGLRTQTPVAPQTYGKTTNENVNIRADASTRANLVTRIKVSGTPVEIVYASVNDDGEWWYAVHFGGYQGYIRTDLIVEITEHEYQDLQEAFGGTPIDHQFVMSYSTWEIDREAEPQPERIGNSATMKFHRPGCYSLPDVRYQVSFSTREAAIGGGYVPCKNCVP